MDAMNDSFGYDFDFGWGKAEHAGRAVIAPAPETSGDRAQLHALLAQASITSLPSVDTLRSASVSMAPTAEYIAAMQMSGVPEAMRGPGEALADKLAAGHRADMLPEHRHLLQFAAGDKVTAHPGAAEALGLPIVRGAVASAFIKRFNKLAPVHQAKWYLRAREQLEQLWEEAGVHDWDRQQFRKLHCLGGATDTKAAAMALHAQLLAMHLNSRADALATIQQREQVLAALRQRLSSEPLAASGIPSSRQGLPQLQPRAAVAVGPGIGHSGGARGSGRLCAEVVAHKQRRAEVRALMLSLLRLSLQVVEHVRAWRRTLWRPQPMLHAGRNYLSKVTRDMRWLYSDTFAAALQHLSVPKDELSMLKAFDRYDQCGAPLSALQARDARLAGKLLRCQDAQAGAMFATDEPRSEHAPAAPDIGAGADVSGKLAGAAPVRWVVPRPAAARTPAAVESQAGMAAQHVQYVMLDERGTPRCSCRNVLPAGCLPPAPATIARIDAALAYLAEEHGRQQRLKEEAQDLAARGLFIPALRWRLQDAGEAELRARLDRKARRAEQVLQAQVAHAAASSSDTVGGTGSLTGQLTEASRLPQERARGSSSSSSSSSSACSSSPGNQSSGGSRGSASGTGQPS